ncbi:hypothetical protein P43SY_003782 [Pythium insidiosum]|uniref:Signal peptidase complex subunit 1 n=1 Tax=Pythium insidiosum TaxID=114742 RepID=A0AAD5LN07_PYTIN|nr:hypothetical protein P43SY_003782 [Pythium insidiosum]KAJ0407297.1 hypothetical protein ATCC90586_002225 [Pythium insidiosum]
MVDYKGQALAERYLALCFIVICAPAWVYGYLQQDFKYPLYAWGAATIVAALVVLPNWGMYNRHPIKWLPSVKYKKKAKAN